MKNKDGMKHVRLHSGTVVEVSEWKGKPYPRLYGTSCTDTNSMKDFLVTRLMTSFLQSSIGERLTNGGFDGKPTNGISVILRKPWTSVMTESKKIEIQVGCDIGVSQSMTAYGTLTDNRAMLHAQLMDCPFYLDILKATIIGEPFERGTPVEDMRGMITLLASEYTEDPDYIGHFLDSLMQTKQFKQALETAQGQVHFKARAHIKQLVADKRLTSQYKVA